MKPFVYCPACGSGLKEPDAHKGSKCQSCGRSWYRNAAPTVGAAIVDSDRALLTVRGRDPFKGKLDVPGGFLEPGESPLDGLKREVKEELDLEVDVTHSDFIQAEPHRYGEDGEWLLSLGYVVRIVSGEPSPADDVAGVRWVGSDELDEVDWAWPHDRELVRKALSDV